MKIKLLSWNIWINGYFDQIKKLLKSSSADIIGLQEVKNDDPKRDVIGYLNALGYKHVFKPIEHGWKGKKFFDGPAIFCKFDILESGVKILSEKEPRAAAFVKVLIDGKVLNIFSTHLIHTHQQRNAVQTDQAKNLVEMLGEEKTILMGDFNSTPDSEVVGIVEKKMVNTDSRNLATWCLYPGGCRECNIQSISIKLDYIFVSRDIKINRFEVLESRGSDHLPIMAELELK